MKTLTKSTILLFFSPKSSLFDLYFLLFNHVFFLLFPLAFPFRYTHDREYRSRRHNDDEDNHHSVHFDQSERSSDDARPVNRRPTPVARPKGPSKGGRQRDY